MRRIGFMEPIEFVSGKWAPESQKSPTTADRATAGYEASNINETPVFISHLRVRMGNKGKIANRLYYSIKTAHTNSNSANSIAARQRFKAISAAVRTAYAVPETLATYTAQWKAQGVNMTLRKYIWDAESAKIEP